MRVLIVDDSVLFQKIMAKTFDRCAFIDSYTQKYNVPDAKIFIAKEEVDVIICDIQMPEHNGFKLLEHVKQLDKNIVVIMFSDYNFPQYKTKAQELGADYFLNKSLDADLLIPTLKKLHGDRNT